MLKVNKKTPLERRHCGARGLERKWQSVIWGRGSENAILRVMYFLNNPQAKQQQNMRNNENIGRIVQGKRFVTSLSRTCKIFSATSSFMKVSK